MPISKYFSGHGEEVMKAMKKQYGAKAEQVFYATANKRKQKPKDSAFKAGMRHGKAA